MSKILPKVGVFLHILLLPLSLVSFENNTNIVIDISEQRLYLMENDHIMESFPISSSKYGEGSIENSLKHHWESIPLKKKLELECP